MTAEKKIAQKQLTMLQVAERIRNVSIACRHHSVSRIQFYEYNISINGHFRRKALTGLGTGRRFRRVFRTKRLFPPGTESSECP